MGMKRMEKKNDTAYWNLSQDKKNHLAGNETSWR